MKLSKKDQEIYDQCKGECDRCLLDRACCLQDKLMQIGWLFGNKDCN